MAKANDELVKPDNRDFSFRQDHLTGFRHNYELYPNPSHDYNSAFEQLLDINLQIGGSCEASEIWNHFQEHKVMPLQDSTIKHIDEATKEAIGNHQSDSFLSFPDSETVIEASQKQESQEINNDDLAYNTIDFTPSPPPPPPPSSQCWSLPGAGPDHEMAVGMEFPDVHACRKALRDTAISLRFEMHTIKSDKTRFTAKCMGEGCPWRIHCAKVPNAPTFTIRTIHGSHTCGGISHLGHQQASVTWVAEVLAEKLKENPHLKPKEILEEIHRVHGIALSYKQAWRGKERIMASLRCSFDEEYRLLPQYCEEIKRTNPGSVAVVHANPIDESFQQLFISFQASISGFLNSCRPLIALDKACLKSKYPGTLLLATGFDGDGAVFPLAFAIVNEENDSNWFQFLSELGKSLEANSENNMPRLTILSTMEKQIADGVESSFPTAFHGLCVHHLTEQFQREFHNSDLVSLLWEAAHSLTVLEYTSKMNKIEQISPEAFLWIQSFSPSLWASSCFEGTRYGRLTANVITESLRSWIEDASGLPIIQMMECFHIRLMSLFKERRETSLHWSGELVPSAEKQLLDAMEQSRVHRVYRANEAEFEVMTGEGSVVVDIEKRSCLCRRWEIHGLPCSHAVGALLSCEEDVYKYAEGCFSSESYRRTYAESVEPVSEKVEWKAERDADGEDGIRTPRAIRDVRRRKRVRAEDVGRVKRVVHCGRCNQTGHFRTTCVAPM
ncbi:unnamed protein product [Microthlaspi erraticum]|uniref:SWIM-type domain-containing protein n=1 Tax=Microthlaspi erraticum TaxID=1685480 RepID=A0A6D2ICB8_9BRAS|nr:unnamed protein product [Microthlaspi erraticum]